LLKSWHTPRQAQVRISIHLRYNLQPAGTFGPNLFEPPAWCWRRLPLAEEEL